MSLESGASLVSRLLYGLQRDMSGWSPDLSAPRTVLNGGRSELDTWLYCRVKTSQPPHPSVATTPTNRAGFVPEAGRPFLISSLFYRAGDVPHAFKEQSELFTHALPSPK
ncbi:unnamed protein product [Pleuronectes platessa]|uniref:Uncharacterized protein n=1 Tax=Pleuronectes platessa TaxID=8262 RepID=A0A9N7Y9Z6_PLEPL|nr:unnamed protein product [Pleuronectes platessa]